MTFDTLKFDDVEQYISPLKDDGYTANRLYYDEDHWQNTKGWIGPRGDGSSTVMDEIKAGFVSKNVVAEVLDRHQGAVIGKEPAWSLTVRRPLGENEKPKPDEEKLINEAEALLTEYWDSDKQALKVFQDAVITLLLRGRSVLRLLVPPAELTESDGRFQVPGGDLPTSLARIYLETPDPEKATVAIDTDSMRKVGIYKYKRKIGEEDVAFAELTYLDDQGNTVIRIVSEREGEQVSDPLNLGGRLWMFEMEGPKLISEQFRKNQALMNMALSMMGRNVVVGGFLERVILNAQMPGYWEDDPKQAGKKRFVAEPYKVGAGTTNYIQGAVVTDREGKPVLDSQGKPTIAAPSVVYRDPVDVKTFTDTKAEAYANMLEEAQQVHALISKDATASGESRRQAMADFLMSVRKTSAQVNAAGRWFLETALSLAAIFAGEPGKFDGLRANFAVRVDAGPVPSVEQEQARANVKDRLISRQTAMTTIGIEDPDAELTQIKAEETEFSRPVERVQLQRAQIGLRADQRSADGGIRSRIAGAGNGSGTVDATNTQVA